MIGLRVTTITDNGVTPENYSRDDSAKGVSDKTSIEAVAESPYGFRLQFERLLIIGEALRPQTNESLFRLAESMADSSLERTNVSDDIVIAVLLDLADRSVVIFSSISCNRWLYYYLKRGELVCSTDPLLLAKFGVSLKLDEASVPEFLAYRYVIAPRTMFADISRTIGGQTIRINVGAGEITNTTQHNFRFSHSGHIDCDEAAADVSHLLRKGLETPLDEYSNPLVLLSGGLDSSLLAALSLDNSPQIASASSSFSFIANDDGESHYAMTAAKALGISHKIHTTTETDYLRGIVDSIFLAREPVHHLQSVMLHLLYKESAADGHDIVISGEGADGLFGNDFHSILHRRGHILTKLSKLGITRLFRTLSKAATGADYRWQLLLNDYSSEHGSNAHLLWKVGQYGDTRTIQDLTACDVDDIVGFRRELISSFDISSTLDKVSVLSLLGEGAVSMHIWSVLAERHGLAVSYPFVSPSLINLVTNTSWNCKLREPKYLIRSALRSRGIPKPIIDRPKLSFALPYKYWATKGSLLQPVVDMAAEMYGEKMLVSVQTEDPGKAMILWSLLNLYLWKQLMVDNVDSQALGDELVERHRHHVRNRRR